jgi:hypothetical protein
VDSGTAASTDRSSYRTISSREGKQSKTKNKKRKARKQTSTNWQMPVCWFLVQNQLPLKPKITLLKEKEVEQNMKENKTHLKLNKTEFGTSHVTTTPEREREGERVDGFFRVRIESEARPRRTV